MRHDYYTPDALHPLDPYALAVVQHMVTHARQDYRREEEENMIDTLEEWGGYEP